MGFLSKLASATGLSSESVSLFRAAPTTAFLNDPDCDDDVVTAYKVTGGSGIGDYTTHYDNVSVCGAGIARNVKVKQNGPDSAEISFDIDEDWTEEELHAAIDAVIAAHTT